MGDLTFGPFVLCNGPRLLLRDGEAVHIAAKPYRLLEVLLEHRPNALSKQQIHDLVWPDVYVSDATIASVVAELREALADDPAAPAYIRTVYGFGYAFHADVREAESAPRGYIECMGRQTALSREQNVIGRDPAAAIFVDDATVSRHHAMLTITGEDVTLEDLDSKNGTFISGRAVVREKIQDGAEFHVGAVRLVFRRRLATNPTVTFEPHQ